MSAEGRLVFEFTVGQKHVYFPNQARWWTLAPEWAREQWQRYLEACQLWCQQERIPISVVGDAHFYEEK